MSYAESGRTLVPTASVSSYQTRAELFLTAITGTTLAEATALGYEAAYTQAVYAVMDQVFVADQAAGKTSESIGGVSVSYDVSKSADQKMYRAAAPYLISTGLLYRGG